MFARSVLIALAALSLAGCFGEPSPSTVLAKGTLCGDVKLSPSLHMRTMGYVSRGDHETVFVVHACDGGSANCQPIASFFHAPLAAFDLQPGGRLRVDIFGGRVKHIREGSLQVGKTTYFVSIRELGKSRYESAEAFDARLGPNRSCDPAAEL